jgi:carboxymethylenebutenolidase
MSTVTLQAADGATFRGVLAIADDARGAGVVVLPGRDGLRGFHAGLAERFAAAGHHAIAIDLFGRTAGVAPRPADFDTAPHAARLTARGVDLDVRAAAELIGLRTGARRCVVVGFGLGGAHALRCAGDPWPELAGAVAVSPRLRPGDGRAAVVPVLAVFGGEDDPGAVAALGAALAQAGVERELVTYHGAPAGFLEDGGRAAGDAWERILGFVEPAALERAA